MLTVPEAARRVGRTPETVRRWIRSGRLRARKVGTQHVVEENDLEAVAGEPTLVQIPEGWRYFSDGTPQPDWERVVRRSREGHLRSS
jgi:excisionase family DNA binding protein